MTSSANFWCDELILWALKQLRTGDSQSAVDCLALRATGSLGGTCAYSTTKVLDALLFLHVILFLETEIHFISYIKESGGIFLFLRRWAARFLTKNPSW
jgi:hypothetical protein